MHVHAIRIYTSWRNWLRSGVLASGDIYVGSYTCSYLPTYSHMGLVPASNVVWFSDTKRVATVSGPIVSRPSCLLDMDSVIRGNGVNRRLKVLCGGKETILKRLCSDTL